MLAPRLVLACLLFSCTAVQAIITQQDPDAIKPAQVDPRNHYYLPEEVQTPKQPDNNTASPIRRRAPANVVARAPAPTTSTGALICGPNSPCVDGSCCGKNNICGFGDDYCKAGCQSGCTANSPCGRDSAGGSVKCGMNLCCSYYGWCGATADYCTTSNFGCQQGFGSCATHAPFQCDAGAASATKRTIGYYQGGNVYSTDRKCGQVKPSDIKKDKYTHLYWAFAEINPSTFEVMPSNSQDTSIYQDFTKLKSPGKLETWIGVGGFDFTTANPGAWTDMVGSAAHRQTFIRSLMTFMKQYGFQGVDLDWEYPVDNKRGGHANDMVNLVQLVADMRASPDFGHSFGISVTLAPDLWYLQYFDAKGLLASADWLGFMSYDLHGLWDADVPNIGKKVYGQTDLNDIERDLIPLWYDLTPADMSRVNFGLALYGRGYTLADPSCNRGDGTCTWTAGNKPGPCSATEGVMSLVEIQALIKDKGLTPVAVNDGKGNSMMKQITWDDQWIGYDDDDTIKAKTEFASSRCFGGTMAWSVDLEVGSITDGGDPSKNNDNKNIWHFAPQFQHDAFPPYPRLNISDDGTSSNSLNLRATHLFGWKGCQETEVKLIEDAYDDFYTLAQEAALWNHIDWNDPVIVDFFGPVLPNPIPDDTRKEIQRTSSNGPAIPLIMTEHAAEIFAAAQQVYNFPWVPVYPWLPFEYLWIEVRCSSASDKDADPADKCGDRAHAPPQCPPPGYQPPSNDEDKRLEAFSEPNEKYSRITFCNLFFGLATLSESIRNNRNQPQSIKNDLSQYNSRARLFFHEIAHLDYFMNAKDPTKDDESHGKSPEVFDAEITINENYQTYVTPASGPLYCKILRNFIPDSVDDVGYYTQRNADTYAWVAVAKYVQAQLGFYPSAPRPGLRKPLKAPTKSLGGEIMFAGSTDGSSDEGLLGGDEDNSGVADFRIPGCGDRYDTNDGTDTAPPVDGWPSSICLSGVMGNGPCSSPQPAPTTPPVTQPSPTKKPVTCDIDCGSEIKPIQVCECHCSDGRNYRITNNSPPCVP